MTNTEKLLAAGALFPSWINSENFINTILSLSGEGLYNAFGFKDSTSCSKFLDKYIPGRPKNMKFSTHVKNLLIQKPQTILIRTRISVEVVRN